ncbi:MAG: hypothetical protein ACRDQU_00900 [Pseudonocardiaceae bacterium]
MADVYNQAGQPGVHLVDSLGNVVSVTNPLVTTSGGATTTAIAAGTVANTVIKASPGRLCRVLVTATGTNAAQIFDNATTNAGTVIGGLPASPALGTSVDFQMPAVNGITVGGNAGNPALTVSFY